MPKAALGVVVPAYNEELVIGASLKALKRVVNKKHIFVVSDGSKDATAKIARQQGVNVMDLRKNVGKARALHKLIVSRNLVNRYKYLLFSDADSRLSKDFVKHVQSAAKDRPACIVGTVSSDKKGFISAFRTYEYGLSHMLYKRSQNIMHTITCAPGCASMYRSDILNKLEFSSRTITEDYDLTLQIHHKNLGQIVYVPKAEVITQDPGTFKDYWTQIVRWQTGYWQNLFLHRLYTLNKLVNWESNLILVDSIFGISLLLLAIFHPIVSFEILRATYLWFVSIGLIVLLLLRKWWALVYLPFFPFFYLISIAAYIYSFFRATTAGRRELSWGKVARYAVS